MALNEKGQDTELKITGRQETGQTCSMWCEAETTYFLEDKDKDKDMCVSFDPNNDSAKKGDSLLWRKSFWQIIAFNFIW